MSSFSPVFEQNEALKNMSGEDRMKIMIKVYNHLKEQPDIAPVKLRRFREAQKQTMYEYDTQEGQPFAGMSFEDWDNVYREGKTAQSRVDPLTTMAGTVGEEFTDKRITPTPSQARQQQYDYMKWEDRAADLKDFACAAGDIKSYPTRIAKSASDLFGIIDGLSGTVSGVVEDLVQSRVPKIYFSTDYFNSPIAKAIEEKYGEVIADDPEMYKIADSIMIDTLIGAGFGTAGVKVATKVGAGFSQKAAAFFAPVASNVIGGRLVDMGAAGLAEAFNDISMSESERNGVKIALLLGVGLASGLTIEPLIEKGIKGLAKKAKNTPDIDNNLLSLIEGRSPQTAITIQDTGRQMLTLPETQALKALSAGQSTKALPAAEVASTPIALGSEVISPKPFPLSNILSKQNVQDVEKINELTKGFANLAYKELTEEKAVVRDFFDYLATLLPKQGYNAEAVFESLSQPTRLEIAKHVFNGSEESINSVQNIITQQVKRIDEGAVKLPKTGKPKAEPSRKLFENKEREVPIQEPVQFPNKENTRATSINRPAKRVENVGLLNSAMKDLDTYAKAVEGAHKDIAKAMKAGDANLVSQLEAQVGSLKDAMQNSQAALLLVNYGKEYLGKILDKAIKTATEKGNTGWAKTLVKRKEALKYVEDFGTPVEQIAKNNVEAAEKPIIRKAEEKKTLFNKKEITAKTEKDKVETPEPITGAANNKTAERSDPLTRFEALEPVEQNRVRNIVKALEEAEISYTGIGLTTERKLEILESALDHPYVTGKNFDNRVDVYTPDKSGVNMGFIEREYPAVSALLTKLAPDTLVTGITTPETIAGAMQSLVSRAGLGLGARAYEESRELYKEMFDLWDSVKERISSKQDVTKIADYLQTNSGKYMLTPEQAFTIGKALEKVFPELDFAIVDAVTPKGASSLFDALTKTVTNDPKGSSLQSLIHELGHYHFYYALDSESRLSWLDDIHKYTDNEDSWASIFPGYEARKQNLLQNKDVVTKEDVKMEYWLSNPAELYAEQFRVYLTSNILPSVNTLKSFGKLQKSIKDLLMNANKDFKKLPNTTQYALKKLLAAPDPSEAKRVPMADIEKALKDNYLYQDKDNAMIRVEEISRALDEKYAYGRAGFEGNSLETFETPEAVTDVGSPSILSMPVAERVQMYTMEELQDVIEMQSLRILHDLPYASLEELSMAVSRLEGMLNPKSRAELIETRMQAETANAVRYNSNNTLDDFGNLQKDLDDYNHDWNGLDDEAKEMATAEELSRNKNRRWFITEAIDAALKESGYRLNKSDREFLIRACMEEENFSSLEGFADAATAEKAFQQLIKEEKERAAKAGLLNQSRRDKFDGVRASIAQELSAADVNLEYLKKLANAAMAKKGLVDVIDGNFQSRLYQAEAFAKMPETDGSTMLEIAKRASLVGRAMLSLYGGLEADPDGTYIPGLGRVKFSLDRYLANPGYALMFPYMPTMLAKGGKKGVQALSTNKFTASTVDKAQKTLKALDKVFGPHSGASPHVQDILAGGKNFGASVKQRYSDLAEELLHRFSNTEREYIGKLADGSIKFEDLPEKLRNKDIEFFVKYIRNLYDNIFDTLEDLGVTTDDFIGGRGEYINRIYTSQKKAVRKAVYTDSDVQPIKMGFLKGDKLNFTVKNYKGRKVLDMLQKDAIEEGMPLEVGTRLNYYKDMFGTGYWAVDGSDIDKTYNSMYSSYEPNVNWDKSSGGYTITEIGKKSIKIDAPLSPAQRELKGEVSDISVRLAAMGEALEKNMQRAYIYKRLDIPDYTIDLENLDDLRFMRGDTAYPDFSAAKRYIEEHGYVKVPDDIDKATGLKKYGALAGKYIDPAAWDAVKASNPGVWERKLHSKLAEKDAYSYLLKAHKTALRVVKASMTAYNPVTHMNNIMSNMFMGFLLGHNVVKELEHGVHLMRLRNWDIQAKKATNKGDLKTRDELVKKMQDSPYYESYNKIRSVRMSDSSQWSAEIRSDDLLESLMKQGKEKKTPTNATQMFWQKAKGILADTAKRVHEGVSKSYEGEDLLFKMGAFHIALEEGLTESAALRRAYEAYFDYSQVAPGIRFLRDTGIVPFVTYTYKAIPALMKAAQEHPGRLALIAAALEGLHLANISANYGTDNVIEVRDALEASQPDWQSSKALGGLIRTNIFMGNRQRETASGKKVETASYMDIGRWFPGSDIYNVSGKNPTDVEFSLLGVGELLGSFLCQSPVINLATMAKTRVNPYMDTPINKGGDLRADPVIKRTQDAYIKEVFNTIVPNLPFIPGTYSYDTMVKGLVGNNIISPEIASYLPFNNAGTGVDNNGLAKPMTTVGAGMLGIKFRENIPELSLRQQNSVMKYELNKEKSRFNKLRKSPAYTKEDKLKARDEFKETALQTKERVQENVSHLKILRRARQKELGGQALVH